MRLCHYCTLPTRLPSHKDTAVRVAAIHKVNESTRCRPTNRRVRNTGDFTGVDRAEIVQYATRVLDCCVAHTATIAKMTLPPLLLPSGNVAPMRR